MIRSLQWFRPIGAFWRLMLGAGLLALSGAAAAQEEAIPLVEERDFISNRDQFFWRMESARRALESGLYEVAGASAQSLLAEMGMSAEASAMARLRLILIDSLMGRGLNAEAGSMLAQMERGGLLLDSVAVRKGVLALAKKDSPGAAAAVEGLTFSGLDEGERAWLALIRGWLSLQRGENETAMSVFETARGFASRQSPALAAQIAFLAFRYQLEVGSVFSLEDLEAMYQQSRGSEAGFRYAQLLAIALDEDGRAEAALAVVDQAVEEIPETYAELKDQFLLLKLLISGVDTDAGRNAARSLAIQGGNVSLQQIALQQLFSKGLEEAERLGQALSAALDAIIASEPVHPLAAEALYYKGIQSFRGGDYLAVEGIADQLRDRFPDSPYRKGFLALQASASWQRSRFRTAASFLSQLRAEFNDEMEAGALNVLIADCFFRAGVQAGGDPEDFANAAGAYRVALGASLDDQTASNVFFQLVLSYLNADEIDQAKAVLDDVALRSRSSPLMTWRAEWMLIKEMRKRGESGAAYQRVEGIAGLSDLNLSLRMRMLWLGGKLAFESGLHAETRAWVDRLNAILDEVGGDREFVNQVKSSARLTLAESLLKLGESEEGLRLLADLREEFSGSESAERSYLVEARYLSDQDLVVEAWQLLNFLVDNYPESKFAPQALYEGALNAEKRGQDEYLMQANELLDRIANDYPDSDMVYLARLKQGHLLRKLNQFGPAELVYELLENTYRDRPDRYWAQISLADTLIAQASEDPSKFEAGISRLELLMDLPNVPMALRVEAGYKRGNAWKNQGELLKAKAAYWDLYDLFVGEEMRVRQLGREGRYWLSRTIFELAEIFEDQTELDMAIEFYEKIESLGLMGSETARSRIEQLRPKLPLADAP